MRLDEIVGIAREYFFLALMAVIVLGIFFLLMYFLVYKKLFGGRKSLSKKRLLLVGAFLCYVLTVIGVTFLSRAPSFRGGADLSLFSSYRDAWNNFSVRHWQFIYLNILMFVPFGFLLPLLNVRFRKLVWTVGMAAFFTLSIEVVQFITGFGIFDIDDLFNNLLGAIIGYGIIMGFVAIKEKRGAQTLLCFSPLLLVVILSGSMFAYYHFKEFGNLSIVPIQKTDMAQAKTTIDVKLNDRKMTATVFKAPSYTKDDAEEFVRAFFKRIKLDATEMEVISYPDVGVYWIRGEQSYNIWFNFADGSYSYTDFSNLDDDKKLKDTDEETLKAKLREFGINIPQHARFRKDDTGVFQWTVAKKQIKNRLIEGFLVADYYSDDTVKRIENQIVTYDKVKDVQIKSEQEAYKEILNGEFQSYSEKIIKTLHIENVELSYHLDSKGYYQPVYAFYSLVDGKKMTILIPGIQ